MPIDPQETGGNIYIYIYILLILESELNNFSFQKFLMLDSGSFWRHISVN